MTARKVFAAGMAVAIIAGMLSISYYATRPHYVPPRLQVVDGNGSYLVEGNFSGWYDYNSPGFNFSTNTSIGQTSYSVSSFSMRIQTSLYNYSLGGAQGNYFDIGVSFLVSAHLAPNIDPSSLVIVANDTGFQTSKVIQLSFDPYPWGNNTNTSYHMMNDYVVIAGIGSVYAPISLVNQTIASKWHNFAFFAGFDIMIWPNTDFGIHHFGFLANLKGLGVPVYVCANITYVQQ
ncbi:MAG: hypothetical protein KIS30_04365 [Thermoplasmata archaeon]|nr:hypothetical protein [Candidatus Sysuiplasma acidicola]MBX8645977.1 hypothetical protein [Candidatus Sysuiplasma acidicola]